MGSFCSLLLMLSINIHALETPSNAKLLSIGKFIKQATQKDTIFEGILIDELTLRYAKDLKLPPRDLVLSIKHEHAIFMDHTENDPSDSVELSRLFPMTGTEVSTEYALDSTANSNKKTSQLSVSAAQPIARNAFGKSTRLLSKIIGLETDVARFQITEAYEDYLAYIMSLYLDWYEAYENLKIGQSSYNENLKLKSNIEARRRSNIALPIDVNKLVLQLLGKKEKLINLEEQYKSRLNLIETAIRYNGKAPLVPDKPQNIEMPEGVFKDLFSVFKSTSRTYQILDLLEGKSRFELAKDAHDLLPSIDLMVSFVREDDNVRTTVPDEVLNAGIVFKWPLPDQTARARREISRINEKKTKLSTLNTHHRIRTQLKNLFQRLEKESKLMAIADEKIELSGSIVRDESENYTFGKATLNDYISAVNTLDNNRFNQISRQVLALKLSIEWQRATDTLITTTPLR
ncbi:TolC family protein [Elusimicrobiota bacterium]